MKSIIDNFLSGSVGHHLLFWVVLIPTFYIAIIVQQFLHEVVGHGFIGWLAGANLHGFSLTSASTSLPPDATIFTLFVQTLGGNTVNLIAGVVLFKLISRRMVFPSIRIVLVATASLCMLNVVLPAAVSFWIRKEVDYVSLLKLIDLNSNITLLVLSISGAIGLFYVASYSITRMLEEAWAGEKLTDEPVKDAFLMIGLPFNLYSIVLIYHFMIRKPDPYYFLIVISSIAVLNLMLPFVSKNVKSQIKRRRLKYKGFAIIFLLAFILLMARYGLFGAGLFWSAPV